MRAGRVANEAGALALFRLNHVFRRRLGGDRAADELARDHGGLGIVEIRLQIVDPERVDITADHDRIGRPRPSEEIEQPPPGRRVTIPAIRVDLDARADLRIRLGHEGLLTDHVPARPAFAQPRLQPAFLPRAQQRRLGVPALVAALDAVGSTTPGLGAGLWAAVLPIVEQVKTGQLAESHAGMDTHIGAERDHRPTQRQVLVISLIGRRAPPQEPGRLVIVFGTCAGVIVFDLVVVPGDHPRTQGMRGLKVGIRLVTREAGPVIIERDRLRPFMMAHVVPAPGRLVDVIAQVDDQIQIVGQHMPVGRVIPLLVLLAGPRGEAQPRRGGIQRRRGPGAADRAGRVAGMEAVPIPAVRFQARQFGVHRMAPVRRRVTGGPGDDLAESLVRRDLDADRNAHRRHTAGGRKRLGGQAGPEHETIGQGITRGHPERKRVGGEFHPGLYTERQGAGQCQTAERMKEMATIHLGVQAQGLERSWLPTTARRDRTRWRKAKNLRTRPARGLPIREDIIGKPGGILSDSCYVLTTAGQVSRPGSLDPSGASVMNPCLTTPAIP